MQGGVASVTFDRPEARNAMTWAMYEQLRGICEQLREDPSVRVVRSEPSSLGLPCHSRPGAVLEVEIHAAYSLPPCQTGAAGTPPPKSGPLSCR